MLLHTLYKYSEICLIRTLSKPKICLIQTDFTVPSTKCLCNLNLCKPNTFLNWANYAVTKGFGIDRFYCIHNMGNWNHPFCREVSLWTDHNCLNPSLFLTTCIKPANWAFMYMYVKGIDFASVSMNMQLDFGIVLTGWWFVFFIV